MCFLACAGAPALFAQAAGALCEPHYQAILAEASTGSIRTLELMWALVGTGLLATILVVAATLRVLWRMARIGETFAAARAALRAMRAPG